MAKSIIPPKPHQKNPAQKPPALTQAPKSTDPLRYDDTLIALSKARAAHDLLSACAHCDDIVGDALKTVRSELTDTQRMERLEWIQGFADDALKAALDEVEEAYRKSRSGQAVAA